MENKEDSTMGWYKSPSGRMQYLSHMEVIWMEGATGKTWKRVPEFHQEFKAYKILPRYGYEETNKDPFSICIVNCQNGNMLEGVEIAMLLKDLSNSKCRVKEEDHGWFIVYE